MSPSGNGKLLASLAAITAPLVIALAAPALAKDSNKDRLPDGWEKQNHLSLKVKQQKRDPDHDKLNNKSEFKYRANPRKADTDGDGLKDGREIEEGTNPRNPDSDGDGLSDGLEVQIDYDPTDPDTDGDNLPDGLEAVGYITSFNGVKLTIGLLRGGSLSGVVDANTYIACDRESPDEDLDGECTPADLRPGVLVSDAEFDELAPGIVDEVDLVGVY